MKNLLLIALILLLLAAIGWIVWANWGGQLDQIPAHLSALISRGLTGIVDGLAGFGRAVRDSFRIPAP